MTHHAFGLALRALRQRRGVSQVALAEASGLAPRTVQRVETGTHRLTLDAALRLAQALGSTVDAMLADPGETSDTPS